MGETIKKVLFVNSEMTPFLPGSRIADICRNLFSVYNNCAHVTFKAPLGFY